MSKPAHAAIVLALSLSAQPVNAELAPQADGTVVDEATGLTWDRCAWGQHGNDCGSGAAAAHTWAQSLAIADQANAAIHKGYTDWRLPNRTELESLLRLDAQPAIDVIAFPHAAMQAYWSSTSDAANPSRAWHVDVTDGAMATQAKSAGGFAVRLVRGGRDGAAFDAGDTRPPVFTDGPTVVADLDATTATLQLTASEDVTGVYRVLPLDGAFEVVLRAGVPTTFPIHRLLPAKQYTVTLEVRDSAGNGRNASVNFGTPPVGLWRALPSGGEGRIGMFAGECRLLADSGFLPPSSIPDAPPPGLALAADIGVFRAYSCNAPPATIQILYSTPLPQGAQFWRYGRDVADGVPRWYHDTTAVVDGNTITLAAGDGVPGEDDDQLPNGEFSGRGAPMGLPNSIVFDQPPAQTVGKPYTASAHATSGEPVVFGTRTPDVCTIDAVTGVAQFQRPGDCTLQAEQGVTGPYVAAMPVHRTFGVEGLGVDLVVSKDNGAAQLVDGQVTVYRIVVRNAGPDDATDVAVQDTVPATLVDASWACVPEASTAPCPTPSAGSEHLAANLDLPAGHAVAFDLMATVQAGGAAGVANTASATAAETELDTTNNQATDEDPVRLPSLFTDGFEAR